MLRKTCLAALVVLALPLATTQAGVRIGVGIGVPVYGGYVRRVLRTVLPRVPLLLPVWVLPPCLRGSGACRGAAGPGLCSAGSDSGLCPAGSGSDLCPAGLQLFAATGSELLFAAIAPELCSAAGPGLFAALRPESAAGSSSVSPSGTQAGCRRPVIRGCASGPAWERSFEGCASVSLSRTTSIPGESSPRGTQQAESSRASGLNPARVRIPKLGNPPIIRLLARGSRQPA